MSITSSVSETLKIFPFDYLSKELNYFIFDFFDEKALQICTKISKPWNSFTIEWINNNKVKKLVKFLNELLPTIDDKNTQKKSLIIIRDAIENKFWVSLKDFFSFRNQIVDVLITLENFKAIIDSQSYNDNIADGAIKEFEIRTETKLKEKSDEIKNMVSSYINSENLERAIDIANQLHGLLEL